MSLIVGSRPEGPFTVISVAGEIDMATVSGLRDALETALHQPDPRLILDLSRVDFCDSSGLAVLVAARRRLPAEAPLRLAGAQPIVARVLQVTGLAEVFPQFRSVTEAINAADSSTTA
ncbi:MAG: anti-sigma factor antagonist [Frankiales bacterium]|jgi:anti-sigma B factor antagonist|nr:anti-sigma factor antagonist [Frankiales bacterium]